MSKKIKFAGLCGSLRAASYSAAVCRAIEQLLIERGYSLELINIGDIPHYNQDLEDNALPDVVQHARDCVAQADAVLVVTPEFNHGLPGVLKNTLDWLSRPAFSGCFIHKPSLFCTLSPGALGGVRVQYQLRETLSSMLAELYPLREIAIPFVGQKVEGNILTDQATLDVIAKSLDLFLQRIEERNALTKIY